MTLATESQLTYFLRTVNETKNRPARADGFFPLSDVQAGSSVRIKLVSASPEITSRLREMGFCEEQKIRLISQHTHVICQVCHARLGISRQLAEKIMVEPLTGQKAA
jgi:ferrous iron transport protein A